MLKITFPESSAKRPASVDTLVLLVGSDKKLSAEAAKIDKEMAGTLSKALKNNKKFEGKVGQCTTIAAPAKLAYNQVIITGTGKDTKTLEWEKVGAAIVAQLNTLGAVNAAVESVGGKNAGVAAAHIGLGAQLRFWRFDKYFTKGAAAEKQSLKSLAVAGGKAAAKTYGDLEKIMAGVFLTRELVTEPANVINPETLAKRCQELKSDGIAVEVLGEAQMKKLGMGALLGVGQGSVKESKLVIMRWNGATNKKEAPIAFVGKGVTFDTGGISIKPSGGMEEMKWDMGGAGTVIGLMKALAGRKAKVNVVGVVGLVENMPDGNAQRPGDVVTSMSGQTIEVINTDAEGRLVLADALWYTQEKFKPRFVVDLATLTGAVIIALGYKKAGLYTNNDKFAEQLLKSSEATGEDIWRMPLDDYYDKLIDSDIADIRNSVETREAGSITAAQFLKRFIKEPTPWAHLDIAGTAWTKKTVGTVPKGASAFGVRLLNQLVADYYEK